MSKICSKCKQLKPLTQFSKDNHAKSGYRSHCKKCKNKETMIYWRKVRSNRKRTELYNITPEQYNTLFELQKGCCAICGRHQNSFKKSLSVDHNHKTKEVRGLLCDRCNLMVGYSRESIIILKNTIQYLKLSN